jgi:hypothetical protein
VNHNKSIFILLIFTSAVFLFQGCTPALTPTPYIPPAKLITAIPPTPKEETLPPTIIPTIISFASPTSPAPCTDGLTFIVDLTIPDGTIVQPGEVIQKQWLVENSGTCNWDARYKLKLINGSQMGAKTESVLYPARAGTEATLSLKFIAPSEPGSYGNAWQAIAPNGDPFGDLFFMQVVVQPIAEITIEVVE